MSIRPPTIPASLWARMSPEDQQQAAIEYFGPGAGPSIGGFAPAPPPPPPAPPTAAPAPPTAPPSGLTPLRPPNIPKELWGRMSAEDQQQARIDYWGAEAGPAIGGFAPAGPAPPPTTAPPRVAEGHNPAATTWAYVRWLASFPGNHPYFAEDRAAGIGGYMLEAHDPLVDTGAQMCQEAGFAVGIWSDPHGVDPATWAADVLAVAHRVGAVAVAPDPESTGKGYAGSAGWDWNAAAAAALRAGDPAITIIVTPTPNQDDFNYAAWIAAGAVIWVQLYGEKLTDLYNAADVINRLKANGVPDNLIGALIPAGAVQQYIDALSALGVTHWAIYTIDDVSPADRAVPFGPPEPVSPGPEPGGSPPPPGGPPPPLGSPLPDDAMLPPLDGPPYDDADVGYAEGVEADDTDDEELSRLILAEYVSDFEADEDDQADYELGPGSSHGVGPGVSIE